MAERKCLEGDLSRVVTGFDDEAILKGLQAHADPEWWRKEAVRDNNLAYLRRWGCYLRREARRRGLL